MSCSMSLQNQLHQLDFWICHELRWTRTLKSNTAHLQWAPLPEFSTSFWPQQLTCHLLPTDEGPNNSDWSNMEIVSGLALLGRRSIASHSKYCLKMRQFKTKQSSSKKCWISIMIFALPNSVHPDCRRMRELAVCPLTTVPFCSWENKIGQRI